MACSPECRGSKRVSICRNRDLPIEIRPQHSGANRCEAFQDFGRRVAETIAAANQQSAALARLLVIVENYPNLKANEQFNRLSDELAGTENRIAVERMRYNERVQEYNTSRRQFPGIITAKIFSFQDYPLFEAPQSAQQVPKVSF